MRDIAARAGVSQSLLHHHFKSKDALWNLVGERISADFLNYMAELISPDVPPEDSIPRAVRNYMTYWREHPAALRFNLWRLLEGPTSERQSRSRSLNERSVPVFQRAQRAGFIRKDMPAGLAMIIIGSLVQFWLHSQTEIRDALELSGHPRMDDEEFLDYALGLILTGPRRTRSPRGKKKDRTTPGRSSR